MFRLRLNHLQGASGTSKNQGTGLLSVVFTVLCVARLRATHRSVNIIVIGALVGTVQINNLTV